MINFIKNLFGSKPVETVAEVPYKVEVAPTTVANQATQAVVESIAPAKTAPAKTAPAKTAPAAKKPRAPKAPKAVK